MKKTSLIASMALISSIGLVGCGGGGGTSTASKIENVSISGTAIDPELQNATVCLDLNLDMSCSEGEPTATTDANGVFSLSVTQAQLDGSAPLLVLDGTDKESGDAFKGKLISDVTTAMQNITPLTTSAYTYRERNMEKLEQVLGFSYEVMQENTIKLANDEDNTAPLRVALALEKSAEALSPKDPVQFYQDFADAVEKANDTASLKDVILSITPISLQSKMGPFLEDILKTSISDAYALSEFARDEALRWGIDFESMLEKINNL